MKLIPENHTVPDSLELLFGTSSGTVADLQVLNDGNTYDITEASGAPGQELIITFVNVIRFKHIATKAFYEIKSGTAHSVQLQLFDFLTNQWDTQITYESGSGTNYRFIDVDNAQEYISGIGETKMRFFHEASGNTQHDTFIEYLALVR